ncbi:hypothetical protein M8818_004823 [Zalaria obscura]|uniref:Uncharacterized protein n=1 Tax=Zalaria obscura TaxID=2024903 RepID=A0ACC3SAN6_9PEZI
MTSFQATTSNGQARLGISNRTDLPSTSLSMVFRSAVLQRISPSGPYTMLVSNQIVRSRAGLEASSPRRHPEKSVLGSTILQAWWSVSTEQLKLRQPFLSGICYVGDRIYTGATLD